MRAEIIAVGSELLTPYRWDSNSLFLTEKLQEMGIQVAYKTVVGDNREDLHKALKDAGKRANVIIMTGGLGPTEDDLTREAVANFLKRELRMDERILDSIRHFFKSHSMKMPEINLRQAFVIEGGTVLENPFGTAPGQWIDAGQTKFALLPGPPSEMKPMVEHHLLPLLAPFAGHRLLTKTLKTVGLGESAVEERVSDLVTGLKNPIFTILAQPGEVEIDLTLKEKEKEEGGEARLEKLFAAIVERLQENIFTFRRQETLEEAVVSLLKEKGLHLSLAESCTGGLISHRITDVPGSSEVFETGYTVYGTPAKVRLLGVSQETLDRCGVVSRETALEMAEGAKREAGSDYALGVTGIAGPTGGTEETPVGSVWIALAGPSGSTATFYHFIGERERVKRSASQAALTLLWKELKNGGKG